MRPSMADKINKVCPECGSPLVARRNKATDSEFLGCTRWPGCNYTEGIPEYYRLRAQGAEPLPGFGEEM